MIDKSLIENLPSSIGVYLFKKNNQVLYVGKSLNIKARVRSHLENAKLDRKEFLIVSQTDKIDFIVVDSEFEALVLEAELIKKYLPKYNVLWKDGKSYLYIKITIKDEYPKVLLSRKEDDKKSLYFGPFSSTRIAQDLINDIRKIIPFCTEKRLSKNPCFYSKIGLCSPCPNFIEKQEKEIKDQLKKIYQNNIKKVILILKGKVKKILKSFYQQLKNLVKKEDYEEAIIIRNKIFRLEKLIGQSKFNFYQFLIKDNQKDLNLLIEELRKYFPEIKRLSRIECYDISNLGEDIQTASMVVMTDGEIDKKEYRKFKIKEKITSDFQRINHVLLRRFNHSWPEPDLIVIDGGLPQVKIVLEVLKKIKKNIPVLGIAKNPDRLVIFKNNKKQVIYYPQSHRGFNLIRLLRDESHRFAKKYLFYLRGKNFLI